jgi:hypothetical protein
MTRKILGIAAVFVSLPAPAVGQAGWIYVIPPVDEVKIGAVIESSQSVTEKRLAAQRFVRAQAPLAEWIQEAAFDSARECENFRLEYVGATINGDINRELRLIMRERARELVRNAGSKALDGELGPDLRDLMREELAREERAREREELLRKLPEALRQRAREQFGKMERLVDRPFVESAVRARQSAASRCVPAAAMYPRQ